MAERLDFGLLGPLRVRRDGVVLPIPPGRPRALLAALLLARSQLVSADELVEALWPAGPPTTVRASLQNYVSRLRVALGETGRARILTQPRGYLLRADPGELDVSSFEVLLRSAGKAARAGSWAQAAAGAQEALSLWRGEPLADVESDTLARREIPRLGELRLQALEARLDADLHLDGQTDAIPELRQLVSAHPLRERLHELLMLALYQCGRQAEALAAYRDARLVLIEELGIEPGRGLRELHRRILTGDTGPAISGAAGPSSVAAPRTLPGAVSHFRGRSHELSVLTGLLEKAGQEAEGTGLISVIGGTAGVGKTALAVYWAHQVADRFPDGQLYVNLRGYDPGEPLPPGAALAAFLQTLGVPGAQIPAGEDERAARYCSMLSRRRMLVLLDNAGSADQVRPLLPAAAGCVALVTSRDSLAGLVARDGARRLDLGLLPLADATGLLAALIGERAVADPAGTAALAEQCARLPLALRVAAERVTARIASSLAAVAADLADEQRRLDLLEAGGDPRTAVRAVFSWSYGHLGQAAARAFRLAALHPGPDLDAYAVAALTASTLEQASHLLDQLAQAYLIQPSEASLPGRYGLHDLLRAYARELAAGHDAAKERRAALTRLFDHYQHTSLTAVNVLYPADQHRRPRTGNPASPVPPVETSAQAQAWLDSERASLVAVVTHAAAHGWPDHAIRLELALFRYLDTGGHLADASVVHDCALRAARQAADRGAEAEALLSLGTVDLRQGRYQQAIGRLGQSLEMFRAAGDKPGQARALHNLGAIDLHQGGYQQADDYFRLAAALYHETADLYGEARALGNLGVVAIQQGHYQQAAGYQRQVLAMFRELGDRSGEAHALIHLGNLERRLDRCEPAASHLQQGLEMFREMGDRSGEAYALTDLGDAVLRLGHYRRAIGHHQQALSLFRETGNPAGQVKALNGLGEASLRAGRTFDARLRHTSVLRLASRIDDTYELARAHDGLGHAWQELGDPGQASYQWQQALILYTRLGTPEAARVRDQLTSVASLAAPKKT